MKIFLTGVTGFLGGELLVELSKKPEVDQLFCLIRALDEENAVKRIEKIFNLHGDYYDRKKVIPIVGDLSDTQLSHQLLNNNLLNEVDTVIHSAANTSFTKIYDDLVEKVNIGGTQQILKWASTLKKLNLFTYVGTATICGSDVQNYIVKEDVSPNLTAKHIVKYSYTKMMGELLLKNYLPVEKILVVRPSIIMGDSREWAPRSYVILWALATLNELRLVPINMNSKVDVISIEYATRSIIELLFNKQRKYNTYHISSGEESHTTPLLVTNTIKKYFTEKPDFKFVDKKLLSEMKKWTKNTTQLNRESHLYPYKNYLDYWINNFGDNTKLRILFYALEPYINFIELNQVFDNSRLLEDTKVGNSIPAHIYLKTSGKHLNSINVFEGAIDA
ncbi:MAG: SDR family oxidoreductase [Bacteroidia bacterium]